MTSTAAERKAAERARHKEAGRVPVTVYVYPEARELLEMTDRTPDAPDARSACPAVCALADQHGWDTPLYRADHLLGNGQLRPEPVTPLDAGMAALLARGGQWRVYGHEDVALAAADAPDALFDAPSGWHARRALREQLIAVEALADGH